jgi:hypothetical protein
MKTTVYIYKPKDSGNLIIGKSPMKSTGFIGKAEVELDEITNKLSINWKK